MTKLLARMVLALTVVLLACRGGGGPTPGGSSPWSPFDECGATGDLTKLQPILTCVAIEGSSRIAIFGYRNDGATTAIAPVGPGNRLVPEPDPSSADGRLRPIAVFEPGFVRAAFSIRQSASAPKPAWQLGSETTAVDADACALSYSDGNVFATLPPIGGAPGERVLISPSETSGLLGSIVPTEGSLQGPQGAQLIAERPAGTFSVTADGAATYTIAFEIPAGRAGMQPSLGLEYSSRAANGLVGNGWSLAGISQITRCAPTREDGRRADAISFQSQDTLCLDGDPLIAAPTVPDPQFPTLATTFHPEHDPFTRVRLTTSGFVVERRDGRVQRYGGPGAMLRTARTSVDPSGYPEYGDGLESTLAWYITETADRHGNAVRYTYESDGYIERNCTTTNNPCSAGELRPREITYAHGPDAPATRRIEFVYEDRDDKTLAWIQTFPLRQSKRLREVRVFGPNPTATALIRTYRLDYHYGLVSKRSRLGRVWECDQGGVCKLPLELSYEEGDPYYDIAATDLSPAPFQGKDLYAFDANHDGLDDMVYRVGRSATGKTVNFGGGRSIFLGFGDWVYRRAEIVGGVPRFAPPVSFKVLERLIWDDVVPPAGFGDNRPAVLFENGRAWFPVDSAETSGLRVHWARCLFGAGAACSETWMDLTDDPRFSASALDLNGDGVDDPFVVSNAVLGVQLAQTRKWSLLHAEASDEFFTWRGFGLGGSGTGAPTLTPLRRAGVSHTLFDFNGDGLTDSFDSVPGESFAPVIYAGIGEGRFRRLDAPPIPVVEWRWPQTAGWPSAGTMVLDQDQTGAGKVLVYAGESASIGPGATSAKLLDIRYTDAGFVGEWRNGPETAPGVPVIDRIYAPSFSQVGRVFDINGDGLDDIFMPGKIAVRRGKKADLLKGAVGATTVAITNAPHVAPRESCAAPMLCGSRALWVVSDYRITPTLGAGAATVRFRYDDPATNLSTGVFVGFRRVTQTTSETGQVIVTDYDRYMEPYFARRPTRIERRVMAAPGYQLQDVRTFEYTTRSYIPGTTEVLVSLTTETSFERGVTVRTHQLASEYDAFANPFRLRKTTIVGELFATMTDQTEFFHRNDEVQWILGQPEAVLETSEVSDAASIAPQPPRARRVKRFDVDPATGLTRAVFLQEGAGDAQELRREFVRDSRGQVIVIKESDRSGRLRQIELRWDKLDGTFPSMSIDPNGLITRVQYHSGLGVVAAAEAPNGVMQRYRYDGFGRLRAALSPTCSGACPVVNADRLISYAGDVSARPDASIAIVVTQAGAPVQRTLVDSLGRTVRTESQLADGRFALRELDWHPHFWGALEEERKAGDAGLILKWQATRYTLDRGGRPSRIERDEAAGVAVTRFAYEPNRVTTTGPTGAVTRVVRDGAGRVVQSERYNGLSSEFPPTNQWLTTRIAYGPFSQPAKVVDSGGNVTSMTYDALGRRLTVVDPDAGVTTTAYDAFSHVVLERNALGIETEFRWDAAGRLLGRRAPDGLTCLAWDSAPGGTGQLGLARHFAPAGEPSVEWHDYDGLGRPVAQHEQVGSSAALLSRFAYDAHGRLASITFPNGTALSNEYSATGHLTGLVDDAGVPLWRGTANDLTGHWTSELTGDGLTTANEFDAFDDRLARTTITDGAGGVRDEQSLTYFRDGKLRRRVERFPADGGANVLKTDEFAYDFVKRLRLWTGSVRSAPPGGVASTKTFTVNYSYDAVSNLSMRTTTLGGSAPVDELFASGPSGTSVPGQPPHGVVSGPRGAYHYDDAGRQTSAPGRTVTWTSFNKPARVETDTTAVTFDYNASLARVRRRSADGAATTTYALDGAYEERVENGVVTQVITMAGPGSAAIQMVRGPDGIRRTLFLHRDRLGSPYLITNALGGVVERPSHEPFGERVDVTNPTSPPTGAGTVTRGFTGHEHDDDLGLINMHGRVYDAKVGRFTSPDPVAGFGDSLMLNRFSYVGNDPINLVDPSGYNSAPPHSSGGSNDQGGWSASFNPLGLLGYLLGLFNPGSGSSPVPIIGAAYTWGGPANSSQKGRVALAPRAAPFIPIITARIPLGSEGGVVEKRSGLSPELEESARETFKDLPKFLYGQYMRQPHWYTAEMRDHDEKFEFALNATLFVASVVFMPARVARVLGGVTRAIAPYVVASIPSDSTGDPVPSMLIAVAGFRTLELPPLAGRPVRGYSVAAEVEIPEIGAGTRYAHRKAANDALRYQVSSDPEIAARFEQMGIKVPTGDGTPLGWHWHHAGGPGRMQLVPKFQHTGRDWQPLLHPDGRGGFAIWGKEF